MLTTAIPFWADRNFPPQMAGEIAKMLHASQVVDYFQVWDQLTSWWPRALWRPDTTPLAEAVPDCDSFQDAFISAAFAAAAAPELGVAVSTDAIRRGPAELLQTMLTLTSATGGRGLFMIGAGELKQARPFGYKRSEGLARMEDLLRIIRLLLDSDGLIEHQGYHWRYQNAWIGSAVPHKPQIWILGGGPKLMELAARYADGYVSAIPCAYQSPEQFAEEVVRIRRIVEENGRDPEQFGFGLWYNLLLHDDDDLLERAINNPLVRWISAIAGRFDQADWQREGIEPLFPLDWQYSLRLLPAELSRAEADAIVAKSPRSVTEKSYICGNAKEVASVLRGYADAGATFHSILDMAPTVMSLAEAPASLQRSIDVCRALKA